VLKWLKPNAQVVALIKPQFEAGRERVGKGGVVRDPEIHAEVLRSIWHATSDLGFTPIDLIRSPISGPAGNIEFLIWLSVAPNNPIEPPCPIDDLLPRVLVERM
jgi:23S rRNA (cytidine1920-2'-O)/16S rRNA (cytidine1409-2'-O)-methyltransferase